MYQMSSGSLLRKSATIILGAVLLLGASFSSPLKADDIGDWRKDVIKKIIKSHVYPRSAISREIEGAAKVRITISRTGEITSYEIVEATGQSVLDDAIPTMVEKMNPLPSPPDGLPDANLTFVIPVSWRLQ